MQVPLDYYRILGVPIQVREHQQITQAYQDRALQLPRREYSDGAIAARKKLLDQAYEIIFHPNRRAEYDRQLLQKEKTKDTEILGNEQVTPTIEVSEEDFVGALLILQELGEYELVLRLGHPYLREQSETNPEKAQIFRGDIVLTIGLACLELSREDWQQGKYEHAAISGETGLKLLSQEGLFPSLRAEIQADLYRLRPYRILELLALPDRDISQRRKGLHLLQEILQERGGIDGAGDDRSGLNIDEFLRFLQQLRTYLSVAEQQELFEAEAERPSPVATYLAIYALLARGFATKKPELILRAQKLLLRLGKKQDVHLEQAVCALLLGQTEEASRALELSQEYESLAFIRENSQEDPDLLPGLCLYAESWLQKEVFSHFRDLINQEASLAEYFANQEVQTYLEQLSDEQLTENNLSKEETQEVNNSPETIQPDVAITTEKPSPEQILALNQSTSSLTSFNRLDGAEQKLRRRQKSSNSHRQQGKIPPVTRRKKSRRLLLKNFFLFTIGLVVLGVGSLSFAYVFFSSKANQKNSASSLNPQQEQLLISLNQPLVKIPTVETNNSDSLTKNKAKAVIETWLASKAQAFSKDYDLDVLNDILAEPLLSQWQNRVQRDKGNNVYKEYQHTVTIRDVKIQQKKPNQAQVEAAVREIAKYYQNEQLIRRNSYDSNLIVRYDLIRQKNQWLVKGIKIIE